jgi:hypothetical protein
MTRRARTLQPPADGDLQPQVKCGARCSSSELCEVGNGAGGRLRSLGRRSGVVRVLLPSGGTVSAERRGPLLHHPAPHTDADPDTVATIHDPRETAEARARAVDGSTH